MKTSKEQIDEEVYLTKAGVNAAIKSLKAGKAPAEDDIRPKMLKAINNFGVRWLTRVYAVLLFRNQCEGEAAIKEKEKVIGDKFRNNLKNY